MVEDAARLDYIKDKIAKRTEEIISNAECEKRANQSQYGTDFLLPLVGAFYNMQV